MNFVTIHMLAEYFSSRVYVQRYNNTLLTCCHGNRGSDQATEEVTTYFGLNISIAVSNTFGSKNDLKRKKVPYFLVQVS
jgi:uncharacterized protein YbbC (DUF1343 family)